MATRNARVGQSCDLVKDFTILKILLLHKHKSESWDSFMSLKSNPRYATSLKSPPEFVKSWTELDPDFFPIANNYLKTIFKDRSVKLEEVVRIFAVFSDVSWFNPE
jgi:hypothetical protein